jgi:antitoxin (DNA-binding transcriptional repressor) of toxin-antitoxin stability system
MRSTHGGPPRDERPPLRALPTLLRAGERLGVTSRNRAVAELRPRPGRSRELDRLIAEGLVSRPTRRGLPRPLRLEGDPYVFSRALDAIGVERSRWPLFYADASTLVKLVRVEPETAVLRRQEHDALANGRLHRAPVRRSGQ